jgi:hypothetical protein
MSKGVWFIALMFLILPIMGQTRQDDQFTPVVVSPLTQTTGSVLGTDDKYHVVYELLFTNTRPQPATLKKIEVLDVSNPSAVIAAYEEGELLARLRTLGNSAADTLEVKFNEARLLLLHLTFNSYADVPLRLLHHVELLGAASPADPTPVPISYTVAPIPLVSSVPVIGPPLAGKGWVAFNGCCEANGVHRATALPVNGRLYYAQRFAIDWMRLDDQGRLAHGNPSEVHSYTSYGADVLAVADGIVVGMLNTLNDQVPPQLPDPKTINVQNVDGNHVVLDIGNGFFAFYAHLQKGSVTVRPGERVKRGQVLGKLGNSGNTSAPHLHFHIMDGPSVLGSNGLPYVIDGFELAGQIPAEQFAAADTDAKLVAKNWGQGLFAQSHSHRRQFPLDLTIVNFTR